MTRKARPAIFTALVAIAAPCIALRPDRAIRVGTGLVSHTLCSATFVSGLDPDLVYAEAVLERLFARKDLATRAVVVIRDGRIIAERYARLAEDVLSTLE